MVGGDGQQRRPARVQALRRRPTATVPTSWSATSTSTSAPRRGQRRRASRSGADELPALDARERNYERRDVTGQLEREPRRARLGLRRAAAPAGPAPGGGAASGAWPSRAATTSACWPASTSCASGGASSGSPSRRACRSPTCRSSATRRWPCRAAYVEPCMWLIDLFEVAPQADAAFLADWESERVASAVLYRALRADVDFRFVAVTPVVDGSPRTRPLRGRRTRRARPTGPRASRSSTPSRCPTARTSASSPAGSAPAPRSPTSAATSARAFTAASARADLRFVNLARWSSPLMFARATQRPAFRDGRRGDLPLSGAHPRALQRLRRRDRSRAQRSRDARQWPA